MQQCYERCCVGERQEESVFRKETQLNELISQDFVCSIVVLIVGLARMAFVALFISFLISNRLIIEIVEEKASEPANITFLDE